MEININKKIVNFIVFFDENVIDLFKMLADSIERVYGNSFRIFAGVSKTALEIIDNDLEKYSKNILFKNIESEMRIFQNDEMLFGGITNLTFARFVIEEIFGEELKNEKFVYLDVDIMLNGEIPNKYLETKENIATRSITNLKNESGGSVEFWANHLLKVANSYPENIRERYLEIREVILNKLNKRDYFNAGVMIINDPKNFYKLTNSIKEDKEKLYLVFDDQTILNYFNNNQQFKIVNDRFINYKVFKDDGFSLKDISIFHFLGPSKSVMRRIYNENYNFNLLNLQNPKNRRFTLIFNLIKEDNKDFLISEIKKEYRDIDYIILKDKEDKIDIIHTQYIYLVNENFLSISTDKLTEISVPNDDKLVFFYEKWKEDISIENYKLNKYSILIPTTMANLIEFIEGDLHFNVDKVKEKDKYIVKWNTNKVIMKEE